MTTPVFHWKDDTLRQPVRHSLQIVSSSSIQIQRAVWGIDSTWAEWSMRADPCRKLGPSQRCCVSPRPAQPGPPPSPLTASPPIFLPNVPYLEGIDEAITRLGIATVCGGLIGINRELRGKPAGMRTHALLSLGAALVTFSSVYLATANRVPGGPVVLDGNVVTRAVQGIIAGVGFLGGGVILKTSDRGTVRHLTTAASLWVVACLGIVCGLGQWALAVAALLITLLVLVIGGPLEAAIRRKIIERLLPAGSAVAAAVTPRMRHTGEQRVVPQGKVVPPPVSTESEDD
ncbi:MAG TPA: MgtC/SapB family protein [Gemmatimonadaceae bacterium]|nr:MgtC/SapB family protein [Gemmatimonadaceae bacterium]